MEQAFNCAVHARVVRRIIDLLLWLRVQDDVIVEGEKSVAALEAAEALIQEELRM